MPLKIGVNVNKIIFLALFFVSNMSFAQFVYGQFKVESTGHFCFQTYEEAYGQALSMLQEKANKTCTSDSAHQITEIQQSIKGCSVKLKASFLCEEHRIFCKPKQYWIKCCDQISKQCWAE